MIAALEQLCAAYGQPLIIESDQGTHFTGVLVQQLALDLQIDWKFHVAYYPQAAGMIERYNGLLKNGLRAVAATPMLRGWTKHLWTVLWTLNERSRRGGPRSGGSLAPPDCCSYSAAGTD